MFFEELKLKFETPVLYVDNQGAIALAKNPVLHQRTKHIDIRYFFIREKIDNTMFLMLYVETQRNLADLFTKSVVLATQRRLLEQLMKPVPDALTKPVDQTMMARVKTLVMKPVEMCMMARVKTCVRSRFSFYPYVQRYRIVAQSRIASISKSRHYPPMVLPCVCRCYFAWSTQLHDWVQICQNCPLTPILAPICTSCGRQVEAVDQFMPDPFMVPDDDVAPVNYSCGYCMHKSSQPASYHSVLQTVHSASRPLYSVLMGDHFLSVRFLCKSTKM